MGLGSIAWASPPEPRWVSIPSGGVQLKALYFSSGGEGAGPAMVLMHGCSGMYDKAGAPLESYVFWADHFRKLGFSTLLLDSFSSRGVKEICTLQRRDILPGRERSADAHAALAWLASQSGVDQARVHLLGWSNGAMAVMHAARVDAWGARTPLAFKSAVAFYPGCANVLKDSGYRLAVPMLIQSGEADDWTPARYCRELTGRLAGRKDSAALEMDSYEGAHHSFDRIGLKVRFRPDVRNPNQASGLGATIGSNPAAREAAIKRTTAWVLARDKAAE